jgi:DNA-binding winged helix-turn-helix (wHTH) protein
VVSANPPESRSKCASPPSGAPSLRRIARFGVFEVDLEAGELRKQGMKIKLQEKPFQVLCLLLERPGMVVTREEIQKRLWPNTIVEFEHNLNTAVQRLRDALDDSADTPRFIETLPRRGYRFIGSLQSAGLLPPRSDR